jgi:hypothetical protein
MAVKGEYMNLTEIANKYQLDKGTLEPKDTFWYSYNNNLRTMGYSTIYDNILDSRRLEVQKMMEIGIYDKRFPGGSLKMWYDYFPNAKIWGVDNFWGNSISKEEINKMTNVRTFIGIADQSDRKAMGTIFDDSGNDFDIIIEDGAHWPSHIMISLAICLPRLKPGGLFFIEDLQSPYGGCIDAYDNIQITQLLQEFISTGLLRRLYITIEEYNYLLQNIKNIKMFPAKDRKLDGLPYYYLACIEKR